MAKDGKDLQRLIRTIETALAADDKRVNIETPKFLPDKVTGELREHDVVLTITAGHHETMLALECRDRSRPIGVNAVEEFANKCRDTGVQGIFVSSKGFHSTALKKAAHYNIACFTLQEAESFDWCLVASMRLHRRTLTKIHQVAVDFPNDLRPPPETLQDQEGRPIAKEVVSQWAMQVVKHYGEPNLASDPLSVEGPGEYTRIAREINPAVWGVIDGAKIRASLLAVTVSYKVEEEFMPLSFKTYRDESKSKELSQAAVVSVEVSEGKFADMVLATNAQGLITMTVVSREEKPKLPRSEKKRVATR